MDDGKKVVRGFTLTSVRLVATRRALMQAVQQSWVRSAPSTIAGAGYRQVY